MKALKITLFFILIVVIAKAQPSESQLLAKIKADHPSATNVELYGKGIITQMVDEENDDAVLYMYYRHYYRSTTPTEYQGISQVYSGGIQYVSNSGSFIFDQYLVGDVWYIGVPDPDKTEILKMLKSDMETFLENAHYIDIVGDVSEITFPADPEFLWHQLTSVSFLVNVTYSEKINYTQVKKAQHTYRVRLYSDEFKGPWKSFMSTREDTDKNSTEELLTYTAEELRAIPSLSQIDAENKVKSSQSDLPSVDVPVFSTGQELFYFIHDIILTKSNNEIKAYLYKLISPNCYQENSTVILNDYNQQWFDKVVNNVDAYRACFCEYPLVKHEQSNMIQFMDKANNRMLRISGNQEEGTWKILSIEFYPASKSEQDEMKGMTQNCQPKPLIVKVEKYKVGDKVTGIFSNGEYNALVEQVDEASNKYYIKLVGDNSGNGYWLEAQFVKPGHTGTLINGGSESNTNSSSGYDFKVNETVYVLTSNGEKVKAEILEIKGDKAMVDFTNAAYQNMWVSLSNCSRKK
jgi:hypothetical protein